MSELTQKGNELSRGNRLQIMLDLDELNAVDDFRFNNRMPSRAAAVRELLRRGLTAVGYTVERNATSRSFGVIETDSVSRDDGEGQG